MIEITLFLSLNSDILLVLFSSSILWVNCLDREETPWRGYRKKQVLRCLSWAKDPCEIKQRYRALRLLLNTLGRLLKYWESCLQYTEMTFSIPCAFCFPGNRRLPMLMSLSSSVIVSASSSGHTSCIAFCSSLCRLLSCCCTS